MSVLPYNKSDSKKRQVEEMFDNISSKYDLLNHLLSLNIDKIWRKKAIKILRKGEISNLLDIATGTGDFAIEASGIKNLEITGLDLSENMLQVAQKKIIKRHLENRIKLVKGDSENLHFGKDSFDAITVAFGVRNFENLEKGLTEMNRVLKPRGICVILEFSVPKNRIVRWFYNLYFKILLPLIGRMVSKDKRAYSYLPESVQQFPSGNDFLKIMEKAGFKNTHHKILTLGIASIYTGVK